MALYLAIQIGAVLSRIVPRPWRYLIGTAVGDLVYRLWGSKRRILLANMGTVLDLPPSDPQVKRLAVKSMRNYCKYLIEFLDLPNLTSSDPLVASMKLTGIEHLHDAISRGKGVVLASAHMGTIEVGGLRLADFTEFHAVYDTFHPPYLDRLVQRKRREKGINLIATDNVREMLRVLRRGDTLTLLFDRPMDVTKGIRVRLFGRDTAVPGGPAVLALKTGATILPVFMVRHSNLTFESVIYPPIVHTPSGNREADVQEIMQQLTDVMQSAIQARPDQWYMFRPMWPELDGVAAGNSALPAGGTARS